MKDNIACYLDYLIPGVYFWIGDLKVSFPFSEYDTEDYPFKLDSKFGFGIVFSIYKYYITPHELDVINVEDWKGVFSKEQLKTIRYKSLREN